ncbi:MAG TPA: sialidase family protein [Thermoanaerobaculia bacterium]
MRKSMLAALLLASLLPAAAVAQRPSWPTLERQLSEDRVPRDSALAELIAKNQEFSLLRPEEARDELPVPLWLRVLWRKAHPEGPYSGDDPTGGYPFVLKELHEWMVSHPDLAKDSSGIQALQAAAAVPRATLSAGTNQRISGAAFNPRSESDIRVNYWEPQRIVAASNNIQSSGALAVFYSDDGGASWRQTLLPLVQNAQFHSDPAVDWTSDGTAWAVAIGIDPGERTLRLQAFQSADGGATWTFDQTISGEHRLADKQLIWTDHSNGSPHKDNLYVIWHNGPSVYVNRRVAATSAWEEPRQISGVETRGTGIGSDVKTNNLGHVFAFWPDTGSRNIFFAKSIDGGASWARPSILGRTWGSFDLQIPAQGRRQALIYVTGGAFYRGPRKNMVYAAWTDLSGIQGCRTPLNEPRLDVNHPCQTRIFFSRSTNGGRTWSAPRAINNAGTRNDQFNPWLVVDETSGALAIIYYDTVTEARVRTNVWAQASIDDGATWSAPFRVTTQSSLATGFSSDPNQYGDYNGLSGIAGTFFPSWTDRRAEGREQIWTAPLVLQVRRNRIASAEPSPALACLFRFLAVDEGWSVEEMLQPICEG